MFIPWQNSNLWRKLQKNNFQIMCLKIKMKIIILVDFILDKRLHNYFIQIKLP